jgi:hypothetical protein
MDPRLKSLRMRCRRVSHRHLALDQVADIGHQQRIRQILRPKARQALAHSLSGSAAAGQLSHNLRSVSIVGSRKKIIVVNGRTRTHGGRRCSDPPTEINEDDGNLIICFMATICDPIRSCGSLLAGTFLNLGFVPVYSLKKSYKHG